LDTLRVVAVFLVFWEHWLPQIHIPGFSPGWWGVHLFFTISGFLISGILLDTKQEAIRLQIPRTHILKSFYIRRFLRIFPLYYMVLLIGYLAEYASIHDYIWWHALYGSNFLWIYEGVVTHFWSLAVEEQFYLFWPLVILMVPQRFTLHAVVIAILVTPFWFLHFRLYQHQELYFAGLYLLGCLHSLGMGALLAILTRKGYHMRPGYTLWALLVLLVAYIGILRYNTYVAISTLAILLAPAINTLIVLFSIRQNFKPLNYIFNNFMLRYLGKISYGLYVIHPFAQYIVQKTFAYFQYPYHLFAGKYQFVGYIIVTIVLSAISWELYEKRINNLKKYFEYLS